MAKRSRMRRMDIERGKYSGKQVEKEIMKGFKYLMKDFEYHSQ